MNHQGLAIENLAARIAAASDRERVRVEFAARFPLLPRTDLVPQFTWGEIERQLRFLSGSDRVLWELQACRKETQDSCPEHLLHLLFILAWSVIDDAPDTLRAMRKEAHMP